MYTKVLFLIMCGAYLHTSSSQSLSLLADLCDQYSRLEVSHEVEPSSDGPMPPFRSLPTQAILTTTLPKCEEPAYDQTPVEAKTDDLSPEMLLLSDMIHCNKQLEALLEKQENIVQKQEDLIQTLSCQILETERLREEASYKKTVFKKTIDQIKQTARNTPNAYVKNVLQALLSSELWSLAQTVTMNEYHLNFFTMGFIRAMPEDFQQDCADQMLSGVQDRNLLEERLASGQTRDILAWTAVTLLDFANPSSTLPVTDETNPLDSEEDRPLCTKSFFLGQKCFDTFMQALQEKGITLSFHTKQEATPQEA